MNRHFDNLLLALILLAMAVVTVLDNFAVKSPLTQGAIGLLTMLTILGGISYIIRLSSEPTQER